MTDTILAGSRRLSKAHNSRFPLIPAKAGFVYFLFDFWAIPGFLTPLKALRGAGGSEVLILSRAAAPPYGLTATKPLLGGIL